MARIDDFRSKLIGGGARSSQFEVQLTFPAIAGANPSIQDSARFLCTSTSLPGSFIQQMEVPFRGRFIKIAGERTFQNWQVTVMNDTDFGIRKAMEKWSQQILNHGSTAGTVNPASYVSDLRVKQLARSDSYNAEERTIRTYVLHNCFPVNVSEIGLDFGDTNQIQRFSVEFAMDYWTAEDIA